MSFEKLLGRRTTLVVRRFGPAGVFLAVDPEDTSLDAPTLLLPRSEVPEGTEPGDEVDVFVYLDSEDRPIASRKEPKLSLGEVAFLEVKENTRFGAFVDWGLPKDLLVPYGEQVYDLHVGRRYPIGLLLDSSGRLAGTTKVSEMLGSTARFELDEWVAGEAWRTEPGLGLFVIVERRYLGLVPASEPVRLARGDVARFRVTHVLPDGKIELSTRGHAHEEIDGDAERMLAVLVRRGTLRVGDRSSPEEIRAAFGLSKKAFKRAAGRLLKDGAVTLDRDGFLVPTGAERRAPDGN